jgi:hypothetical protein
MRTKPKGDEIRVSLDSGANIHSMKSEIVKPENLGFDSKAEWDAASDDDKLKAVQDFFAGDGLPEYSWDDEESAKR